MVQLSKKCRSKILLCHKCNFADTCSIMQVIALGAKQGDDIAVIADGPDEKAVINEMRGLFTEGAGI